MGRYSLGIVIVSIFFSASHRNKEKLLFFNENQKGSIESFDYNDCSGSALSFTNFRFERNLKIMMKEAEANSSRYKICPWP